ncbi:hypothetical protein BO94DRAFT_529754 [Aspergillus sclerotioniger CBS 115572]|uniref:histone acetyltransferase n=1 Tax=Aspergillus sclerotioniger CBS 115572 TaxID=1450535 RepID=A0A317XH26_9EURO|nr:hypothetical protein BO94DRAFT_529754 [Aspergillus sclerotioniger CBS 115572]PWY96370.1 hypothetical protein BO94DRAFT_529754 [Aspergillus sclerotioniger CBS 115572]
MSQVDVDLGELLAEGLPGHVELSIRHVSSTPTPSTALFAAPPGETPEPTFCTNHFLTAAINLDKSNGAEIIVFGMEVLVYSTAHLTTVFVSKADSTGYLHRLATAPKVSLLRRISHTFLSFLVQTHQRPGVRLLVSLFARAQSQYLFPGSIDNPQKHVLDDRGLIKWWCRVVDPILREYEPESGSHQKGLQDHQAESAKSSATAFLIVPGCDRFETRGFFPATARSDDKDRPRWLNSYPVHQLCDNPKAPPRCLIPQFPDDPKTRFVLDLDNELPKKADEVSGENAGHWRSVRSLEQFWEMMSFRQECSAGRLVGFLWLVINPPGLVNSVQMTSSRSVLGDCKSLADNIAKSAGDSATVSKETSGDATSTPEQPSKIATDPGARLSSGRSNDSTSTPAQPAATTDTDPKPPQTADADAFFWPEAGRGHAVLSEADYQTAINFLLDQDFDTEQVAIASTKAWGEKVASLADQLWVGKRVVGRSKKDETSQKTVEVNTLMTSGLVRKRKKADTEVEQTASSKTGDEANNSTGSTTVIAQASGTTSGVNVLQASLIRKKKKT